MQPAQAPRYRKRVPCALTLANGSYAGMVLNLSRSGLFVQTSVRADPGDPIQVVLKPQTDWQPIDLRARVVWKRVVSPRLRSISEAGLGLEIQNAPEGYFDFLANVARLEPPSPRSSADRGGGGSDRTGQASGAQRYRVRVQQVGGPRSRTLHLGAGSEEEARRRTIEMLGAGWAILELAAAS